MSILLADDHGLFRESVASWLDAQGLGIRIVAVASHGEVQQQLEGGLRPRLILLDLNMPGMDGAASLRVLHESWPEIPILVVSANEDPAAIRACIEAGAAGFVPKSGEGRRMLEAIRDVLDGKSVIPAGVMSLATPSFTEKQQNILRCLAEGCTNREIASRVHLTEGTVKQYVSEILGRLGVDNRVQASIRARQILGLNG